MQAFTALEEAFFRAGETLSSLPYDDSPSSWWRRALRTQPWTSIHDEPIGDPEADYESFDLRYEPVELYYADYEITRVARSALVAA